MTAKPASDLESPFVSDELFAPEPRDTQAERAALQSPFLSGLELGDMLAAESLPAQRLFGDEEEFESYPTCRLTDEASCEDEAFMPATARRSPLRIPEGDGELDAFGMGEYEDEFEENVDSKAFEHEDHEKKIEDALKREDWNGALQAAIAAGERDESKLTNLLFFARHPDLDRNRKLEPKTNKADAKLAQEWAKIRDREVWAAIEKSAKNTTLAVSGKEVAAPHRHFLRPGGKPFKQLVAWAAQEVDIDPGLLASALIAEVGGTTSYLTKSKVSSYLVGVDDFYAMRHILAKEVPAYAKIGWDKKQTPDVHLNDAQTKQREVKTIQFNSGRDALLATAVYLKYAQVRLRSDAKDLGGDFDALPIETRFALIRMSMAAGRAGAATRLKRALKGEDILVRNYKPAKAYQTNRNATIRAAQALHLSDWIFGNRPAPSTQPEVDESQEWEDSEESDYLLPEDEYLDADTRDEASTDASSLFSEDSESADQEEWEVEQEDEDLSDATPQWEELVPLSLPPSVPSLPSDAELRKQLQTIGTPEAKAFDRAFSTFGDFGKFSTAMPAALKAVFEPLRSPEDRWRIYLARLGAEAFILNAQIEYHSTYAQFVDHPDNLGNAVRGEDKENFLHFAIRRLRRISEIAVKPDTHRRQMDRAGALFRFIQNELASEYRSVITSETMLVEYRTLLMQIIWKHYQGLLDGWLETAAKSRLPINLLEKQWDKDLRAALLTIQSEDPRSLAPAFRLTPKVYRDYFNPSTATDLGYRHYTRTPVPIVGDGPEISFRKVFRRRIEQKAFVEALHLESDRGQLPKLHDSASWQLWIRKIWDKKQLRRIEKLDLILQHISRYFHTFTIHAPHDVLDGCAQKNFLTRTYPRAIAGVLVHDCVVYALRWLHMLGRLLSLGSTPADIFRPRLFLILMPAHAAVMIRMDTSLFNMPHVLISINNKEAVVHKLDADESDQCAAERVVRHMYDGPATPFTMTRLAAKPSDAKALWNETCKILDKSPPLPFDDAAEPHLRYLRHNAMLARIWNEFADTIRDQWRETLQKLKPAGGQSQIAPATLAAELDRHAALVRKAAQAATDKHKQDLQPLITEIGDVIRANEKRLSKGVLVAKETMPTLPWVRPALEYLQTLEEARKTLDISKIHPDEFFPEKDFAVSVE